MSLVVEETDGAYQLEKGKVYNLEKLRGRWPSKKSMITIGRDASNDIILPAANNYVPREGCVFIKKKSGWFYAPIEGWLQDLKNGDKINIGGIVLKFQQI